VYHFGADRGEASRCCLGLSCKPIPTVLASLFRPTPVGTSFRVHSRRDPARFRGGRTRRKQVNAQGAQVETCSSCGHTRMESGRACDVMGNPQAVVVTAVTCSLFPLTRSDENAILHVCWPTYTEGACNLPNRGDSRNKQWPAYIQILYSAFQATLRLASR